MLELSQLYREEMPSSFYVWRDLVQNVDRVALLVSERDSFEQEAFNLARFVRNLFDPVMEKMGYTPGSDICALIIRVITNEYSLVSDRPSPIRKLVHSIFIVF